jgi:hypothetical protein
MPQRNPGDPDEYDGYEWMTHPCAECGAKLSDQYPYAYCGTCQDTKTCPHGVALTHPCSGCDAASDFAYDAWREKRR